MTRQLFERGLGLLKVGGVKALREPTVDLRQQLAGFCWLALSLPQPTEAHCSPQLQRLRLLAVGDVEGLMKIGFRLMLVRTTLPQQQLSFEPMQFCLPPALPIFVHQNEGLGQYMQPFFELPYSRVGIGQEGMPVRLSCLNTHTLPVG